MPALNKKYTWEISAEQHFFSVPVKGIWQYKDLLFRLVRRDFLTAYQQTILGPVWVFLQPLLITLTYILVFHSVLQVPTGNQPSLPFYLLGIILWSFFSESLSVIANTYHSFAFIFSKVYFPRIIVPLSFLLSALIRFGIQFVLFFFVFFYYWHKGKIQPNEQVIWIPCLLLIFCGLSLGIGLILASLTAKYRDLQNLLGFVLRIWMFVSPVIYPVSVVPEKYRVLIMLNPITPLIEYFRFAFLGAGLHAGNTLLISFLFMMGVLLSGIYLFNRRDGLVMDTI